MIDPNLELLVMLAKHAWEHMTPEERQEMLRKQSEDFARDGIRWVKEYEEWKAGRG